jgi:hypothetical protein
LNELNVPVGFHRVRHRFRSATMCVIQAIRTSPLLAFKVPQAREVLKTKEGLAIFDATKSIANACRFDNVIDINCWLFGVNSRT